MGGVGDVSTESSDGVYTVQLPTFNDERAMLTGVAINKITSTFPVYPTNGQVRNDIHDEYKRAGGNSSDLPILPQSVGGDVDFIVGKKYLRYHPKPNFQLPSGLTIYRSIFKNPDGSRGVIGGPHHIFTTIEKQFNGMGKNSFLCNQLNIFNSGFQVNPDVPLLCTKGLINENGNQNFPKWPISKDFL